MINILDLLGRVLISILFFLNGIFKIYNYDGTIAWMDSYGIPDILIFPAIFIEIIGPILIIIGYQTQISATLLAIFSIATAFIFHFDFSDQMQTIAFFKNFALAGGFLFIDVHGPKEWSMEKKKKFVRL